MTDTGTGWPDFVTPIPTCFEVDGARVHGDPDMSDEARDALSDVLRAARAKLRRMQDDRRTVIGHVARIPLPVTDTITTSMPRDVIEAARRLACDCQGRGSCDGHAPTCPAAPAADRDEHVRRSLS